MKTFIASAAGAAGVLACLSYSTPAEAQGFDVIALYCDDVEMKCATAPIDYAKTVDLPVAFNFDTGWIPGGSDLQVRFALITTANTTVELAGDFETKWPPALRHLTPGRPMTGYLAFDFGIDIIAEGRIDLEILGIPINWQGDLPLLPNYSWHLQRQTQFDSWAFERTPEIAAKTDSFTIIKLNLLNLVGIPSEIAGGGVQLDAYGELRAAYKTNSIKVLPAGLTANEASEILQKGDAVDLDYMGGPFVELDIWPEGVVDYTGAIHLVPTFFLELLPSLGGIDFEIPFIDFPIDFPITSQDFIFDPVRVHVPLPDVKEIPKNEVIDFGEVIVGEFSKDTYELENVGEARARASAFIADNGKDDFTILNSSEVINSNSTTEFRLRFNPKQAGELETTLTFVTNDPDYEMITLTLRGTGVAQDVPMYPEDPPSYGGVGGGSTGTGGVIDATGGVGGTGGDDGRDFRTVPVGDDGGCGCRVAEPSTPYPAFAFAGLGLGLLLARRRRRSPTRS